MFLKEVFCVADISYSSLCWWCKNGLCLNGFGMFDDAASDAATSKVVMLLLFDVFFATVGAAAPRLIFLCFCWFI